MGVREGRPPVVLVAVLEGVRLDDDVLVPDPVADELLDTLPVTVVELVPLTLTLAVVVALTDRVATVVLDAEEVAVLDLEACDVNVVLGDADAVFVGIGVRVLRALADDVFDTTLDAEIVVDPEGDLVPRADLDDVLVREVVSDARDDTVTVEEEDDDLLADAVAVPVRVEVVVRDVVVEDVPLRVDVTERESAALAVLVLDRAAVRVLVGEIKELCEGRDDTVASAVCTEDRVTVAVRVAVRLLVAVRVGKILFSKRYLPRLAITHEGA